MQGELANYYSTHTRVHLCAQLNIIIIAKIIIYVLCIVCIFQCEHVAHPVAVHYVY